MEEPRKLFKTISLEERLAASVYNADPKRTEYTEGGSITLKTTYNTPDLYSQDLKKLQIGGPNQVLPTIVKPVNTLATQLNIPIINSKFASSISLRDRLSQTNVTKTTHLPQYFLSDQYTGYLDIGPFITSPIERQNIGDLQTVILSGIVDSQTNSIMLGSTPTADVVLISQGTVSFFGSFKSLTPDQPVVSTTDNLLTQGTYLTLGQYLSFTNPTTPGTVVQGTVTITPYNTTPNQGPGVDPFTPLTTNNIAILQGLLVSDGVLLGSAIALADPVVGITLENSPTPQLSLLGYEADRALAFLAPKIKHGSSNISTTFETDSSRNPSKDITTPAIGSFKTDPNRNPPKEVTSPAIGSFETDPNRNPPKDTTSPAINEDQPQTIIGQEDVQDISSAVEAGVDFPKSNEGSISAYNALTYGQIKQKQKQVANGAGLGSQRSSKMAPQTGPENKAYFNKDRRYNRQDDFSDFINVIIRGRDSFIRYRAYLDSFSDSFTTNWSDVNYVGRQDTLKQFTGATRSVSFSLKLAAFSKEDVTNNFTKLNQTIATTSVASLGGSGRYLQGPLCRLTLGNILYKTYCVFNSVNMDFDPTQTPMDIDEQLPQLVTLSFDATILAANNDELLNGATNRYYGSPTQQFETNR